MRRFASRLVTSALSFSLGIALALASRLPYGKPFSHLRAQVSGETQLPFQRFARRGGLPDHDEDETNHFNCEFVSDNVGWLANGAKLWRTADGGRVGT